MTIIVFTTQFLTDFKNYTENDQLKIDSGNDIQNYLDTIKNLEDITIVVLGQRLDSNKNTLVITDTIIKRAESALVLYWSIYNKTQISIPIILTGGDPAGLGISESETMSFLLTNTVPATHTINGTPYPIIHNLKIDYN